MYQKHPELRSSNIDAQSPGTTNTTQHQSFSPSVLSPTAFTIYKNGHLQSSTSQGAITPKWWTAITEADQENLSPVSQWEKRCSIPSASVISSIHDTCDKEVGPQLVQIAQDNRERGHHDEMTEPDTDPELLASADDPQVNLLPFYSKVARRQYSVERALSFYHTCFSNITLTYEVDSRINPWQAALVHIHDEIPVVRWSALALARRQLAHLSNQFEGASVLRLKDRILIEFASRLYDIPFAAVVSTALLLIALEYAESGFSKWGVHLRGAYNVLEYHGGIEVARDMPHVQSQIVMLLWYDLTTAMLSRAGPIFPRHYVEKLVSWQPGAGWSLLALNGQSDKVFLDMYDVTAAAAHAKSFSKQSIARLEKKILDAKLDDCGNRSIFLMAEAWKLTLLLYCLRVFRHKEDPNATAAKCHAVATYILTNIAMLPRDSFYQKQCLLPITLAASEMSTTQEDLRLRKAAQDYYRWWKDKSGMWIFDSGMDFVTTVWRQNDAVNENSIDGLRISWTDIFAPDVESGFLFG